MRSLRTLDVLRSRVQPRPNLLLASTQQVRYFSPSRPSPYIINDVLCASSAFIHGVHSFTGLPWVCSIPLTAFIVRMSVALPLQIYSRINVRKVHDLNPLVLSWKKYLQDSIREQNSQKSIPDTAEQANAQLYKEVRKVMHNIHTRWGVSRFYKVANFAQLPVWISLMESLRAMCGSTQGLISWLLSFVRSASDSAPPSPEPTLASEGALWFPDLLAGDPTGILPTALVLSILYNIHVGWKVSAPLSDLATLPKFELQRRTFSRVLRLFVQCLAVNIGISAFFQEMPCVLMIYWISSTNVASVQTHFLEKYMHSTPPLKQWRPKHIAVTEVDKTKQQMKD